MLPTVLKIGLALIGVYLVVSFLMWRFQERLVFPGARAPLPAPAAAGFNDGELVTVVPADNVELGGWYLPPNPPPPAGSKAPGLIWFYGNMETVGALATVLRDLRPPSTGLLILDYRGYGENRGTPTEAALYRDAEAAWTYLTTREEIDSTSIGVYGRSVGSAVALHLATNRPIRSVVLDSPISSAKEMAARHYGFLPPFLVRLSLDNVARAEQLSAPLLVFHGALDRIAPLEMGQAVAAAGRARDLVVFESAGHNETYLLGGSRYRTAMHSFLASTLGKGDRE